MPPPYISTSAPPERPPAGRKPVEAFVESPTVSSYEKVSPGSSTVPFTRDSARPMLWLPFAVFVETVSNSEILTKSFLRSSTVTSAGVVSITAFTVPLTPFSNCLRTASTVFATFSVWPSTLSANTNSPLS